MRAIWGKFNGLNFPVQQYGGELSRCSDFRRSRHGSIRKTGVARKEVRKRPLQMHSICYGHTAFSVRFEQEGAL